MGGKRLAPVTSLRLIKLLPHFPRYLMVDVLTLQDWVGPRTKEFLLNPKKLLRPPDEMELPRLPGKIHIMAEDKLRIADELVARNVCDWVDLDLVYRVKGTPILNGLFGVPKTSNLPDGRPVLRFIMNLTGSNATQFQLESQTSSLPSITSWQSLFC